MYTHFDFENSSHSFSFFFFLSFLFVFLTDALAGWSFGREYLGLYPDGSLEKLSTDVWFVLSKSVQLEETVDRDSEKLRFLARRHALSMLQRLSSEEKVADSLAVMKGSGGGGGSVILSLASFVEAGLKCRGR